jgi:hypothetical protein
MSSIRITTKFGFGAATAFSAETSRQSDPKTATAAMANAVILHAKVRGKPKGMPRLARDDVQIIGHLQRVASFKSPLPSRHCQVEGKLRLPRQEPS